MQLKQIPRDALLKPLQAVSGIVERRHTLPILANVLLEQKDGHPWRLRLVLRLKQRVKFWLGPVGVQSLDVDDLDEQQRFNSSEYQPDEYRMSGQPRELPDDHE